MENYSSLNMYLLFSQLFVFFFFFFFHMRTAYELIQFLRLYEFILYPQRVITCECRNLAGLCWLEFAKSKKLCFFFFFRVKTLSCPLYLFQCTIINCHINLYFIQCVSMCHCKYSILRLKTILTKEFSAKFRSPKFECQRIDNLNATNYN